MSNDVITISKVEMVELLKVEAEKVYFHSLMNAGSHRTILNLMDRFKIKKEEIFKCEVVS